MNLQTFTAESLNTFRQEDLYKASEAVRTERTSVGARKARRFSAVQATANALRARFGTLRPETAAGVSR